MLTRTPARRAVTRVNITFMYSSGGGVREILVSVSQGMSYARIAEARGIKPVTARNAIYGIQQKLGVGSMQELVLWAARNGLLGD